jgi:hypothetical protein
MCDTVLRNLEGEAKSHSPEVHMADAIDKELTNLLARAMEQPGVAETLAVLAEARAAGDVAQEALNSLQPQWIYQATSGTSAM